MESSEHVHVGNNIELTMADGTKVKASNAPLELMPDRDAISPTYGQLVALGGDFFGTPDLSPISQSDSLATSTQAFADAFGTLLHAPDREVSAILAVINEEEAAVDAAIAAGLDPSTAFGKLQDRLSYKWNEITGGGPASGGDTSLATQPGRYMNLAAVNMDHFGPQAALAYQAGHSLALRTASTPQLGSEPSLQARNALLCQAYAVNAFADHFLTDLFASGHVRTPRRALYEMTFSIKQESGILSKCMHDEDNQAGLTLTNARGDRWLAYGDKMERDAVNQANMQLAIAAVQASADEVYHAFVTGQSDMPTPAALQFVPREIHGSPGAPELGRNANNAPLFWADPKDYVYRRGGNFGHWDDAKNWDYTYYWSAPAMATYLIVQRKFKDLPGFH